MVPQKTKFIWFILISAVVEIIFFLYAILQTITYNFTPFVILDIILVIILGIFIYKLYYLKKDILKWVNIAFGYSLFRLLIGNIIGVISIVRLKLENLPSEIIEEIGETSTESLEMFKSFSITFSLVTLAFVFLLNIILWVILRKQLKKKMTEPQQTAPSTEQRF